MSRRSAAHGAWRDVDGLLLFDKPVGLSSNQALQRVRRWYRARKAGHCGSLDPLASGLLPICFGEATKFSSYLLDADKVYRADCRLGISTDTGDAEGEIVERRPVEVSTSAVRAAMAGLTGEIEQVPPMYSALRHQGRRLYELARAGETVERQPRSIRIFRFDLLELDGDRLVFEVHCSKGTYVRTLAEDLGKALGCGAHLTALRRTAVQQFDAAQSLDEAGLVSLAEQGEAATDARLIPISTMLAHFPECRLTAAQTRAIRHGKSVPDPAGTTPGIHRLVDPEGEFIGLGEIAPEGSLKAKRLMNTGR